VNVALWTRARECKWMDEWNEGKYIRQIIVMLCRWKEMSGRTERKDGRMGGKEKGF
jgi:hypothetical protein